MIPWWVSDPVATGAPRVVSDDTGIFGWCPLKSNTSAMTEFTIGSGFGAGFDGYIDAIALRRDAVDRSGKAYDP